MVIKLKHYSQKEDSSSCGSVSLKMIFEYYGKKIPIEKLIRECNPIKGRGISHKKLIEVARKYGFKVNAKNKCSIKEIMQFIDNKKPVIVNYINPQSGRGHYSIVKNYDKNKKQLIFADPSNGDNFKMNFKDFEKAWFNKKRTSEKWMMILENGNARTERKKH